MQTLAGLEDKYHGATVKNIFQKIPEPWREINLTYVRTVLLSISNRIRTDHL